MSIALQLVIVGLLGLGSGFAIGWFLAARRRVAEPVSDDRLENELRQQVSQRETELKEAREQVAELTQARASAEAKQSATEKLLGEQRALHERAIREAKEIQAKALVDLRDTFKALSADTLKQTAPEFLRLPE